MLDIKLIRENPDYVKAAIHKREMDLDHVIDEILDVDQKRREATGAVEAKKAQQNAASKEIPKIKKAGGDASEVLARMKTLSEEIKEADAALSELNEKQQTLMASLPNLPDEDVQPGGKEQNIPDHVWGEKPQFDFEPKDHVTLCESL